MVTVHLSWLHLGVHPSSNHSIECTGCMTSTREVAMPTKCWKNLHDSSCLFTNPFMEQGSQTILICGMSVGGWEYLVFWDGNNRINITRESKIQTQDMLEKSSKNMMVNRTKQWQRSLIYHLLERNKFTSFIFSRSFLEYSFICSFL